MPNPKKVKHMLVERGMTQADLARATGMSASHVSRSLRLDQDIRESTLKNICKALGCKAEDIW